MIIPANVAKITVFVSLLFLFSCQKEGKNPQASENSSLFVEIEKLAQAGSPEGQYHLGMMYNNGEGVRKDPKEAFEWFRKGSDAGDPLAAFKVGCYYNGQFPGVVPVDQKKYFEYTLVAANAGYSYAQGEVGDIYFKQGNTNEAMKWWEFTMLSQKFASTKNKCRTATSASEREQFSEFEFIINILPTNTSR